MTLSKAIATFAIAIATLFAVSTTQAQQSWSTSHETSSSWNSSWSTGPNGTHMSSDQQSSQKSRNSYTNGGRTITNVEDHSQRSGQSQGYDQHGVYNNQYAQQTGKSVITEKQRLNGRYGGTAVHTQRIANKYDNAQGFNQAWGRDGSYNQGGYDNRSSSTKTRNDLRGRDAFGNSFGAGVVKEAKLGQTMNFNQGFNRYGAQTSNQINRGGSIVQKGNQYRW